MPILEGWEISPDRIKKYEKMMAVDPIGDPIITSKCRVGGLNGFLIVSDNGIAWRGLRASSSISTWVRWYDVSNIIPKKNRTIRLELKIRKKGKGVLILDEKDNYKLTKWTLTINKNKGEQISNWNQRKANFNNIMSEIFNRNKVKTDPPTSDSRIYYEMGKKEYINIAIMMIVSCFFIILGIILPPMSEAPPIANYSSIRTFATLGMFMGICLLPTSIIILIKAFKEKKKFE